MRCRTWLLVAAGVLAMAVGSAMAADEAAKPAAPVKAAPAATPTAAPAATPTAAPAATATVAVTPTAAAPTSTAPAATATAEPKKALEGDLATMAKECKLSDEQVGKLQELDASAKAESDKWQKENAAKLEAFQKARNAALMASDEAALRKAMEDIRPQMEEVRALRMKYQTAIANLLTPEQKIIWQSYMTWRAVTNELKQLVNLTDAQSAQIRPLCDAAAKEMSAVKDETEAGLKERYTIQSNLLTKIRETILTPEQRKALEAMMAPPMAPVPSGTAPAVTPTAAAPTPTAPAATPTAPAATPTVPAVTPTVPVTKPAAPTATVPATKPAETSTATPK